MCCQWEQVLADYSGDAGRQDARHIHKVMSFEPVVAAVMAQPESPSRLRDGQQHC